MRQLDLAAIAAIRAAVRAVDPADDDLLSDMIEGETDAGELLDELLEMEATAAAHVEANKGRIKQLQDRNTRLATRGAAARAGMQKLLDAAGLRKMERPAATVGIRALPPKVVGEDIDALPYSLLKISYTADRAAIKAALENGECLPGWSMSNGGETIGVRRT